MIDLWVGWVVIMYSFLPHLTLITLCVDYDANILHYSPRRYHMRPDGDTPSAYELGGW